MIEVEKLSIREIVNGYYFDEGHNAFVCVDCGQSFEIGEMFNINNKFFGAARAIQIHVETTHLERLRKMLESDNKYISFTDNQIKLLSLFYAGLTDNDIAKQLEVSPSTIRHQRFIFREKAKSAKIYLAIWEMASAGLEKNDKSVENKLLPVHGGAKMVDQRYEITEAENQKILGNVFYSLEPLKLKVFPPKEKKKIVILRRIAEQFEKNKQYTEKEVNSILLEIFEDYCTIRRYLIEYGYMSRTKGGRAYWRE
jgi:hypothetical protein